MSAILAAFLALVTLVWGVDLAVNGVSAGALPWMLRQQGVLLTGLWSIALMSLVMVLSTRPVWLERPLGGMDRVYRLHKWAGILAGVFALAHWLIKLSGGLLKSWIGSAGRPPKAELTGLLDTLRHTGKDMGEFAIYLMLALVVVSLWKRIPYKFWRYLHRAMPVIYLLLVFHAVALAPLHWWQQPVGVAMGAMMFAGSVAAAVSLLGRVGRGRQSHGRIVSVRQPGGGITEVVCSLDDGWRGHRPGQFAFVTFDRFEGAHPFTIASADQGDRAVTFQIKALGDYTQSLPGLLRDGQPVTVEGPYGRFELSRHDRTAQQIWVAGGVGVAPFLAWLSGLQAKPDSAPPADLHYCTRDAATDPFVERLRRLCVVLPALTLYIHDDARGQRLDAAGLKITGTRRAEVWFCGPRGLAEHLRGSLKGWSRVRFHQEAFEMR